MTCFLLHDWELGESCIYRRCTKCHRCEKWWSGDVFNHSGWRQEISARKYFERLEKL